MFSIELKFTVDVSVKWFNDVFKSQFNEIDAIKKQKFLKEKRIDLPNEKCVICDLKLAVSLQEGCEKKKKKMTTWYNLTVQKEHLFLRNIYPDKEKSENIGYLKKYYVAFDYFLHIFVILNKYYNKNSNIEDVDHDVLETVLDRTLTLKYNYFLEIFL